MTRRTTPRKTTDAVDILRRRLFADPDGLAGLAEARSNAEIARTIHELRQAAGLTQRELAERVGTSPSVLSRLEDDDYEGHSLSMVRRIARALGCDVKIVFVKSAGRKRQGKTG